MAKYFNWVKISTIAWLTFGVSHAFALTLTSTAFVNQQNIPARYTCQGQNISPPLAWQDVIKGTQGYVLILDDPDAPAGDWIHWLLYSIPANIQQLPEGIVASKQNFQEGENSWGVDGYRGPCPPAGMHHYVFTLYALDQIIPLDSGLTYKQLQDLIKAHVIGSAQLIGTVSHQ